jgi:sugar O-acyltransferase (sialic acid O-acetyltransferase NeuD family)
MQEMQKRLLFYGIGTPYLFECVEVADRAGFVIEGYIHNMPGTAPPEGLHPVYHEANITECPRGIGIVIPLITPGFRKLAEEQALEMGFSEFLSLIDPSAVVARSARWGDGFQVNAGVVVAANCKFGRQVMINRSASIGHDVEAGDYATFGPACVISGSCRIGRGSFIGSGAVVLPKVNIGSNSIIGAGAVVVKDVPDHAVVTGNPGTVIKTGIPGYHDVSV